MAKAMTEGESGSAGARAARTAGDGLAFAGVCQAALVALAVSVGGLAAAISTSDLASAGTARRFGAVSDWALWAAAMLSLPSLGVLGAALALRPRRPVRLVAAVLSAAYCLGVLASYYYLACVLD